MGQKRKEVTIELGPSILVQTYKFDGSPHRQWKARVIKNDFPLLVLDATFDEEIEHVLLGTIAKGTLSTEFYWLDRWYNVFRFSGPDESLRNFYCNINMPPKLADGVLSYVDLDIDVLVNPDYSYRVLDLDEFEENVMSYGYSDQLQSEAMKALDDLKDLIETRRFPFIL